jgi:hypothetical protein
MTQGEVQLGHSNEGPMVGKVDDITVVEVQQEERRCAGERELLASVHEKKGRCEGTGTGVHRPGSGWCYASC